VTPVPKRANKPPCWRFLRARLYFARKTREWPWNVPWQVVYISRKKPDEQAVRYFQRLHGLPEVGYIDRDLARGEELAKDAGWE
jgi:hypothetical protein